jgi:dTDP-4-dehydrorhamnose 3,5-epimerase
MSKLFDFMTTPLNGLYQIERKQINDQRGSFSRLFCAEEFKEIGFFKPFVQVNHSMTKKKGAVRGMHFQYPPYTESKVVTCISGEVLDIVVDIRNNSKTYLQWHSAVLSDKNLRGLYIPEGFAHGFQTLSEDCQLLYLHSEFYTPKAEAVINPLDPMLSIQWPSQISEISEKDENQPMLDTSFNGLDIL